MYDKLLKINISVKFGTKNKNIVLDFKKRMFVFGESETKIVEEKKLLNWLDCFFRTLRNEFGIKSQVAGIHPVGRVDIIEVDKEYTYCLEGERLDKILMWINNI